MNGNEMDLIQFLWTGAGGAGAAAVIAFMLLRRTLKELSDHIDRTERDLTECRRICDARLEKTELEYKQIICTLNEIRVQLARTELIAVMRGNARADTDDY